MAEELTCPNCDSPAVVFHKAAVVFHKATNDHAAVRCGGCGTLLATRGQFRQLLERHAAQSRLVTTGC
jgi:RNase P subunit RPR2